MMKAILFDLDNTLIDRQGAAYDMYSDMVAEVFPDWYRMSIEFETAVQRLMLWDEYGAIGKDHVFGRFCKTYHLAEEWEKKLTDHWVQHFGDYTRSFPESRETLEKLKNKYRIGLLTNGYPHMQRRKLELSGLEDLFEAVVVSGEHGIHKPDPAIFKIACDKMGVLPEEVIFVGDTFSTDIYGAVLSGMKTVFLHSDILHKTKLDMPVIHSIEELPDIL